MRSLKILCLLLVVCTSCKYDKPGSSGTIPDKGYDEIVQTGAYKSIPEILECGSAYVIRATAHDAPVGCDNYDYEMLYQKIQQHLLSRMEDMHCPGNCEYKNPRILFQLGKCDDTQAFVQILISVQCMGNENEILSGLEEADENKLDHPFKDSLDMPMPLQDESLLIRSTYDEESENCPHTFQFRISLTAIVRDCDDVHDYLPYINAVKKKAEMVFTNTRCGPNCTHKKMRELGISWKCENGSVMIDYAMQVECT